MRIVASWFETRGFTALLAMRVWRSTRVDLILRSGHLAASRRMAASSYVASFETLAEFIIGPRFARTRWQAPQDEVGVLHRL
jgi:hypothetical protein